MAPAQQFPVRSEFSRTCESSGGQWYSSKLSRSLGFSQSQTDSSKCSPSWLPALLSAVKAHLLLNRKPSPHLFVISSLAQKYFNTYLHFSHSTFLVDRSCQTGVGIRLAKYLMHWSLHSYLTTTF